MYQFVVEKLSLKKIKDALVKKAVGYNTDEIVEEYVVDDKNNEKLLKKKITRKFVPADLSATKLLLDYFSTKTEEYDGLSEIELDQEALKLFKEYQDLAGIDILSELKGEKNGNNAGDT